MKPKKQLHVEYMFVDYEQLERQKRVNDAYDVIFEDMDFEDPELLVLDLVKDKKIYESR